jgi:hypothetical protein
VSDFVAFKIASAYDCVVNTTLEAISATIRTRQNVASSSDRELLMLIGFDAGLPSQSCRHFTVTIMSNIDAW